MLSVRLVCQWSGQFMALPCSAGLHTKKKKKEPLSSIRGPRPKALGVKNKPTPWSCDFFWQPATSPTDWGFLPPLNTFFVDPTCNRMPRLACECQITRMVHMTQDLLFDIPCGC